MKESFMRILFTLILLISLSWTSTNSCFATDTSITIENWNTAFIDSTIVNVPDSVILSITDCDATASLCIDLLPIIIPSYQLTANGVAYDLGFSPCDVDTIASYATSFLDMGPPYNLVSWNINGVNIASNNFAPDIDALVNLFNGLDPMGNWSHDAINGVISGGQNGNIYSDLVVLKNGIIEQVVPNNISFFENGTLLEFPEGFTEFIILEPATGTRDTFTVNVVCLEHDTINVPLVISDTEILCFDTEDLPGTPVSAINICPGLSGFASNSLFINNDSCLLVTTITQGTDIYCIEVCDDLGFCDTTTYVVNVNVPGTPGSNSFDVDVLLGGNGITCINTGVLLPNAPDTIYNICPASSGESVGVFIDEDTYCINYNGFNVGQDTACIVICDAGGICDTTFLNFDVLAVGASFYYDTVYLNTSEIYCDFDLSELPGTLDTIVNDCAGNTGGFVDFIVNPLTNCVSFEGLAAGKDTACIYLTDDLGNQDTVYMVVCASEPTTETISDTIRLDVAFNYCLDASQLGGTITGDVLFCDPLPSNITVAATPGSLCFDVTGNALGTEEVCVYICDNFGICDTTIFQITVNDEEVLLPPTANPDADTLFLSEMESIVINICENDIIPGNNLTGFQILDEDEGGIGPIDGVAFYNGDCTVTYEPDADFCGESDAFAYEICNDAGCEVAFVNIFVACDNVDLKIFNGFSPNGDGVNDFWEIQGIESIPDNVLTVYNRWGNQVMKIEKYKNDEAWGGDWEGTDLPDGTYFYLLDHGNEAGDRSTGWLVISR